MIGTGPGRSAGSGTRTSVFRWECRCAERPVLLATYDSTGRIHIKVRDRYWHVHGVVQAICPRCGAEHLLDLRGVDPADLAAGVLAAVPPRRPAPPLPGEKEGNGG